MLGHDWLVSALHSSHPVCAGWREQLDNIHAPEAFPFPVETPSDPTTGLSLSPSLCDLPSSPLEPTWQLQVALALCLVKWRLQCLKVILQVSGVRNQSSWAAIQPGFLSSRKKIFFVGTVYLVSQKTRCDRPAFSSATHEWKYLKNVENLELFGSQAAGVEVSLRMESWKMTSCVLEASGSG